MTKHVSLLVRITTLLAVAFVAIGCLESSVTTTTSAALAVVEEDAAAPAAPAAETPAEEAPAEDAAEEAPAEVADDGFAIVDDICTQCHGLQDADSEPITQEGRGILPDKESFAGVWMAAAKADWADTVSRMRETNSCTMTDEEEATIVEWLDANAGI